MGGDLEVSSLGVLYSGRWEKRYWSSSRGKDRYPYPVGFRATRNKYTLEIQEGKAGPIFLIVRDGVTGAGPTPDSAWKDIRKKQCLPGARSSAVTGNEIFGFADPYVQQLLRSLERPASQCQEQHKGTTPCTSRPNNDDRQPTDEPSDIMVDSQEPIAAETTSGNELTDVEKNGKPAVAVHLVANQQDAPEEQHSRTVVFQDHQSVDSQQPFPDAQRCLQPLTAAQLSPEEALLGANRKAVDGIQESISQVADCEQMFEEKRAEFISGQQQVYSEAAKKRQSCDYAAEEGLNSQETDVEITNSQVTDSMISLLLPQASPFLKARKKRRHEKHAAGGDAGGLFDAEGMRNSPQHLRVEPEKLPQFSRAPSIREELENPPRCLHVPDVLGDMEPEKQSQHFHVTGELNSHEKQTQHSHVSNVLEAMEPRKQPQDIEQQPEHFRVSAILENAELEKQESSGPGKQAQHFRVPGAVGDMHQPLGTDHDMKPEKLAETEPYKQVYRHFSSVSKLTGTPEKLEPVVAFEHKLPVLSVVLNAGKRDIDLCVYCDGGGFRKRAFVYRVSVRADLTAEPRILQSLTVASEVHEYCPRFTPDGKGLVVLGRLQSGDNCDVRSDVISVVCLKDAAVQMEIVMHDIVKCLLVTGPSSFVTGGYGGCVTQWQVDCNWRLIQSELLLPAAVYNGVPFHEILELIPLPESPQLVIGSDGEGLFATWDLKTRHLLSTFHTEYHLQSLQLIDSAAHGTGFLCLMANVSSFTERSSFWALAAVNNERVFVGSKLHDSICTAGSIGCYGVAGTREGRVFLWELSTGKIIEELFEQESSITGIATLPAALASVAKDGRVVLYV